MLSVDRHCQSTQKQALRCFPPPSSQHSCYSAALLHHQGCMRTRRIRLRNNRTVCNHIKRHYIAQRGRSRGV